MHFGSIVKVRHARGVSAARCAAVLLGLALICSLPLGGQTPTTPEAQLVQRILDRIGNPTSISLSFSNVSSFPATEIERSRREIEQQFRLHGVRPATPEQAAVSVIVTFSENVRGAVWLAEILEGQTRDVLIFPVARTSSALPGSQNTISLQSRFVLSQDSPILDFVELPASNPAERPILVLSPDKLVLYATQQGRTQATQVINLAAARARTRDPRGRLWVHDNLFEAYLPGYRCDGNTAGTISVSCQQSDDPWPLLSAANSPKAFYANARNFFTGVITPAVRDQALPPFYAASVYNAADGNHLLLATTDGRVQFENGSSLRSSVGSEIATLKAECSDSWFVLGSGATDWTRADGVQLFGINGSELQPAGREVELPGPVLAMWSAGAGQVNVTAHNLQTGAYEAYAISAACRR
ncbi:MAG TPA: hypothetical protein VF493_14930 [Terriglobales bacterium]